MDKPFEHIGLYDFWCIFGAGAVILTCGLLAVIVDLDCLTDIFKHLATFQSDWSLLFIFFYIIVSYIIGLVLHSVSKFAAHILSFNIEKATKRSRFEECKVKWFKNFFVDTLQKHLYKYIVNNTRIKQKINQDNFDECYDYLKNKDKTKRTDKYHSLYGMSRGLFAGFFLLPFILLVYNIHNIFTYLFIVLAVIFLLRAKKYYYKWVECVFIEYKYYKKDEE